MESEAHTSLIIVAVDIDKTCRTGWLEGSAVSFSLHSLLDNKTSAITCLNRN